MKPLTDTLRTGECYKQDRENLVVMELTTRGLQKQTPLDAVSRQVVGDLDPCILTKMNCSVCEGPIKVHDKVLMFQCLHISHADCVERKIKRDNFQNQVARCNTCRKILLGPIIECTVPELSWQSICCTYIRQLVCL